jgi:adenylate kinase family enzyme
MKIAILGNSGSGKSTLAKLISSHHKAEMLDLDTVAFEPGKIAVARSSEAAEREVESFCRSHDHWVVEGCYANLINAALSFKPHLLFLNPGEAQCLAHCKARPWEPHKYASKEEQDKLLEFLLTWVKQYYTRDGEMSLKAHQACFQHYSGPKSALTTAPALDPLGPEWLSWTS